MHTQSQITPASWGMVATLGLIWGATFLFTELALEGITPFWLAAGRIGFAALLAVAVAAGPVAVVLHRLPALRASRFPPSKPVRAQPASAIPKNPC